MQQGGVCGEIAGITMCIFVNECCFDTVLHNLHGIRYDLGASCIENLWNE